MWFETIQALNEDTWSHSKSTLKQVKGSDDIKTMIRANRIMATGDYTED